MFTRKTNSNYYAPSGSEAVEHSETENSVNNNFITISRAVEIYPKYRTTVIKQLYVVICVV
jgi:hypothetical protein